MNSRFAKAFGTLVAATVISAGIITPAAAAPASAGSAAQVLKGVSAGHNLSVVNPNSRRLCDPKCQQ